MSATAPPIPPVTTPPPPPVGAGPEPWRWTAEQHHELGRCGFFDGKRVELVRGEIVQMSPISVAHASGVGLVTDALVVLFALGHYLNVQQPFFVPGAALASEPQPDVAVIAGSRRGATAHPTRAELIVEVADPALFYDTTTKAELYATAGVPEYWVLALTNRLLLVYRDPQSLPAALGTTAYQTRQICGSNDTVAPLAAPGATVRIADLLP